MKNSILYKILIIVIGAGFVLSCREEFEPEIAEYPEITIEDFSPKMARPGASVTITGTNFGDRTEAVTVAFSGVEAEVASTVDNEIVVTVPEQAATGNLSVKVWLSEKQFMDQFIVVPGAKIASYSSTSVGLGDTVTITGTNFGSDADDISISINGVGAEIVSVNDTEIQFRVPDTSTGIFVMKLGAQVIEGPVFLVGIEKVTGILFGHEGSWGDNPDTEIHAGVDGDIETFVDGAGNPGYLGYQIADDMVVAPTMIRFVPRASHPQRMVGAEIRGTNDPANAADPSSGEYDVLYTIEETPEIEVWTQVDLEPVNTTYRYIYYFSPDGNGNLAEIEFYGVITAPVPIRGKLIYEFNDPNPAGDYWVGLQNSSNVIEDGKLKVTFDPSQFEGTSKRRADVTYIEDENSEFPSTSPNGQWHYSAEYPILAMKITFTGTGAPTPGMGNIKLDRFNGAQNNAYLSDYIDDNVLYYDCSIDFTEDQDLASFQFKIADITSTEETGYEIDWIRTFKTVDELNMFLGH